MIRRFAVAASVQAYAALSAQVEACVGRTLMPKLWGNGWFILPNPVYGAGVKGDWDQVFPRDKRWADPAANGGN